jgi:secreted PhoX family phosphatase
MIILRITFLSSVAGPSVATIFVRLSMAGIIAQADINHRYNESVLVTTECHQFSLCCPLSCNQDCPLLNRRRFLQSIAAAAAAPSFEANATARTSTFGPLRPDPAEILDLPTDFQYRIVSRSGDRMSDGLRVPHDHDGMAAFSGDNGRIILICNHELGPENADKSAFDVDAMPAFVKEKIYDAGGGRTPGLGGTTTTTYNPTSGKTERQHMSLIGTEYNCAGGATPWESWLSCEETFHNPGRGLLYHREKSHGYVFEVPARATGLTEAVPIRAMGKFAHEAAAAHPTNGVVYMSEDRHHSLFYRYLPNIPGKLHEGGRLQALAIVDQDAFVTNNWSAIPGIRINEPLRTHWIDLENVDSDKDDLHERGARLGAATFARGEGLCMGQDFVALTCTIGGRAKLGQVFTYEPSPHEGAAQEAENPGQLTLIAEANENSLLRNADNITQSPWGDLFVCEDTSSHCGIIGIRPDGEQYAVADNPYTDSELAGVCFSPDGNILFVNIQYRGLTLAITGPWPAA